MTRSIIGNIQMSSVFDDVITFINFATHFIYKTGQKSHISAMRMLNLCLISTQNKWEIMFILIYFVYKDMLLPVYGKIWKFSKFLCIIYMTNCEAMTSPTHAHLNIHKDWSRNVYRKNAPGPISKCHISWLISRFIILHTDLFYR